MGLLWQTKEDIITGIEAKIAQDLAEKLSIVKEYQQSLADEILKMDASMPENLVRQVKSQFEDYLKSLADRANDFTQAKNNPSAYFFNESVRDNVLEIMSLFSVFHTVSKELLLGGVKASWSESLECVKSGTLTPKQALESVLSQVYISQPAVLGRLNTNQEGAIAFTELAAYFSLCLEELPTYIEAGMFPSGKQP